MLNPHSNASYWSHVDHECRQNSTLFTILNLNVIHIVKHNSKLYLTNRFSLPFPSKPPFDQLSYIIQI